MPPLPWTQSFWPNCLESSNPMTLRSRSIKRARVWPRNSPSAVLASLFPVMGATVTSYQFCWVQCRNFPVTSGLWIFVEWWRRHIHVLPVRFRFQETSTHAKFMFQTHFAAHLRLWWSSKLTNRGPRLLPSGCGIISHSGIFNRMYSGESQTGKWKP